MADSREAVDDYSGRITPSHNLGLVTPIISRYFQKSMVMLLRTNDMALTRGTLCFAKDGPLLKPWTFAVFTMVKICIA